MGYAIAMSNCIGCGRLFSYNPARVPSLRTVAGIREPVCLTCVARVNPMRKKNGLPPIVPLPGAYEPADESELGE
jgi:hypothetical protein